MSNLTSLHAAVALGTQAPPQKPSGPAAQGGASPDMDHLRAAAQDFEAFFISQTLQPMFASVGTNSLFGGGVGEEKWKSFLVDEYGKSIAQAGGFGLADHVLKALIHAQEETP